MEIAITKFLVLYLLFPIMGVLLGVLMFVIAKKNQLLGNKKVLFYFLAGSVLLALPAFLGFIHYWFMPYCYMALAVIYLLAGWANLAIQSLCIKGIEDKPYYVEFLSTFVLMFIGMALFSLIFNLVNELQYGAYAATCMVPFLLPSLFRKTHQCLMDIPVPVYEIWSYRRESDKTPYSDMDSDRIIVVDLEIYKQDDDIVPFKIKAKAGEDVPFGRWFKHFISDYNKKSPKSPMEATDKDDSFGWMFYTRGAVLGRTRHIDPDRTFLENRVKDKASIFAVRVPYDFYDQK